MTGLTSFASGAAVLVVIALFLLLRPFRRRPANADLSRRQLNAAVYRDQFAELERDRAAGILSPADYEQARAELQRRLLEDSQTDGTAATVAAAAPSRAMPVALGLVLPLGAILLYLLLGNPAALNPAATSAPHAQQFTQQDIERMIAGLAAKLESEPENHQGWAMLARSYKALGRFPEAVQAYERTGPTLESSADLLVDYADALAAANGFDAKTMSAIERALKLDPRQPQALWLRGTAAFESKQYAKAVADWEALSALFPTGSEEANVIAANIAEARQLGGLKTAPSAKVGAGGTAPQAAATGGPIKGRVELTPALAGKLPPGGVLMIVARPNDGSRMPVAVLRADAAGLPFAFTLDDSLAMAPDRKPSQFAELLVEARVSQTGQAVPQPGDLFGPAVAVKQGSQNVRLIVDQVRQ